MARILRYFADAEFADAPYRGMAGWAGPVGPAGRPCLVGSKRVHFANAPSVPVMRCTECSIPNRSCVGMLSKAPFGSRFRPSAAPDGPAPHGPAPRPSQAPPQPWPSAFRSQRCTVALPAGLMSASSPLPFGWRCRDPTALWSTRDPPAASHRSDFIAPLSQLTSSLRCRCRLRPWRDSDAAQLGLPLIL